MEKFTKEIITQIYCYKAVDGTEFSNKEECEKYENSALGVIKSTLWKYKIGKPQNAWEFMGEHNIVAFKVPNETVAEKFLQWIFLEHSYYLNPNYEKQRKEVEDKINSAIGDIILFGQDYYLINSVKNIINNLKGLYND